MSKTKIKIESSLVISVLSILISTISIFVAIKSNQIATDAKNTNKDALGIQLDQISQNYASQAYNDLFNSNNNNLITMTKLKSGMLINDRNLLLKVVDIFEEVGNGACQGTIKFRHIRPYLYKSLSYTCNNSEIQKEFAGSKNGLSILCNEFYPESLFAKNLETENLNTCEFWDSNKFQNEQNRYRFETK